VVSLPILAALIGTFAFAVLKKGHKKDERQESETSAANSCCDPEGHNGEAPGLSTVKERVG
jgi:hypothetical protein